MANYQDSPELVLPMIEKPQQQNRGSGLFSFHPAIRKNLLIETTTGLMVIIVGIICIVSIPDHQSNILTAFSIVLIVTGIIILISRPRWYHRASWVLANLSPIQTTITLRRYESAEESYIYAELSDDQILTRANNLQSGQLIKVRLIQHGGLTTAINQPISAKIYTDQTMQGPVVVQIDNQLYWPLNPPER